MKSLLAGIMLAVLGIGWIVLTIWAWRMFSWDGVATFFACLPGILGFFGGLEKLSRV